MSLELLTVKKASISRAAGGGRETTSMPPRAEIDPAARPLMRWPTAYGHSRYRSAHCRAIAPTREIP